MIYERRLHLNEIVGEKGVFSALSELVNSLPVRKESVENCLGKHGVLAAEDIFEALLTGGIFGQSAETFFVSSLGQKVWLLLSAINGADLTSVVSQLTRAHPGTRSYELVTEGMTFDFINGLENRPDFRRIYICSPWVHLKERSKRKLMYALHKAQRAQGNGSKIQIIVIARPIRPEQSGYEAFKETFRVLQRLGAEIVVNPSVHAKIYIREPGPQGGLTLAVVGSENLTGSNNIEIGIRITNDNILIRKLISYYFEVYNRCSPFELER